MFDSSILSYILVAIATALVFFLIGRRVAHGLRENEVLKYEFITIVAHKFRTPLTHVKWLVDSMVVDELEPFKKQSLVEIQKSNQRLIDLTGTLVELTDSDSSSKVLYEFQPLSLCDLARGVAETLKNSFHEKNIFFSVQCSEQDVIVKADRPRTEFVLQTILENAYTYTPPGRNVDVYVGFEQNTAYISVTDHGIGIDRPDLARIFTKFYRGQNAQRADTEGFGVSLYLAQEIMKKQHGRIDAYSEGLDQGATFVMSFPVFTGQ